MKRVLVMAAVVVAGFLGIRAAYRSARVPQLPTAPPPAAVDEPPAVPWLAFGSEPADRYLVHYTGDDAATLYGPEGVHVLAPVPAASGVRHEAAGIVVWTRGENVTFERDGVARAGTRVIGRQQVLERWWREGVRLVATGVEPDWRLLVRADGAELALDFGTARIELSPPAPDLPPGPAPAGRWTFTAGDTVATLTLAPGLCRDAMAGDPFPGEALLEFAGRTLRGCALGLR